MGIRPFISLCVAYVCLIANATALTFITNSTVKPTNANSTHNSTGSVPPHIRTPLSHHPTILPMPGRPLYQRRLLQDDNTVYQTPTETPTETSTDTLTETPTDDYVYSGAYHDELDVAY